LKLLSTLAEVKEAEIDGLVLVPTMGALHEGHLSLVRKGSQLGKPVVVTIFVNPLQFAANEDLSRYPRNLEQDCQLLGGEGVEYVFAPSVAEIYPRVSSKVSVPEVTEEFEGAKRPGHFDGVATVVCKLFQIFRPSAAVFGLKDLQQCAVIERMTQDLNIPVQLCFEPTVRENDGLAKSSRNAYLTAAQRNSAPVLYRELNRCAEAISQGNNVASALEQARVQLTDAGFSIDYFELIDRISFRRTENLNKDSAIIAAAKLGTTRLIDNVLLFTTPNMS
jgi:pantoate--beta-alanine ligase